MGKQHLHRNTNHDYENSDPWTNDKLDRKKTAEKLTTLVSGLRSSFVLSLEGTYGEGKTYFLRNWQKDLQNQGFVTGYFNSWENDHLDDPFIAFLGCLEKAILDHESKKPEFATNHALKKARNFGKNLITKGGPIVAKGFFRYILGDSGLEEIKDLVQSDTENNICDEIGNAVGEALSSQLEQQKSLITFRKNLKDTISDLFKDHENEDQKKIIILVDELDRCKPTFAVKVLERIKHFFDVDGLVFVLGINEKQVANSMSAVYGTKLDTEEYLRRFIHWRFKLPKPTSLNFARLLVEKFELNTYKSLTIKNKDVQNGAIEIHWKYRNHEELAQYFALMSDALGLTLRQQEHAFTALNLYVRTIGEDDLPFAPALGLLTPLWLVQNEPIDPLAPNPTYWKNVIKSTFGQNENHYLKRQTTQLYERIKNQIKNNAKLDIFPSIKSADYFEGTFRAWCTPPGKYMEICHTFHAQNSFHSICDNVEIAEILKEEVDAIVQLNAQIHLTDPKQSILERIWTGLNNNSNLLLESAWT